jgi:uncharacterized phiE125 gp8 family phage protein
LDPRHHDSRRSDHRAAVVTARRHVEELTGRALITQTWDLFLEAFPSEIALRPRLQTVTHVKYIDTNGTLQTLATSQYTVDANAEPGRIVPAYGVSWPGTRSVPNAVQVRFVAGYGLTSDTVPQELRHAIAVLTATLHHYREAYVEQPLAKVPQAFWQLVNQHRIWTA